MRRDIIEPWNVHAFIPLGARPPSIMSWGYSPCPRGIEVNLSKTLSYRKGNQSPEQRRNITKVMKLMGAHLEWEWLSLECLTLWSCEKNMNLGFKRPRFQSWLCYQVAARSPRTSTFSRSHVLWRPQGVNQVSCAASVDICFVSSGIFHGDVSLDRFMAGLGSVPWKHSSCDETRMSSCRLSINQHRHSHSHPNTTTPTQVPSPPAYYLPTSQRHPNHLFKK